MTFTAGEVANYGVRVLLERVGRRYDAARGLSRFDDHSVTALEAVVAHFERSCPYCEGPLLNAHADHLVPTNMTRAGLHAWGNVIWACGTCNGAKGARDWREYLQSISTDEDFARRARRIESFQQAYRYDPKNLRVAELAAELHQGIKQLIGEKVREAEGAAIAEVPATTAANPSPVVDS